MSFSLAVLLLASLLGGVHLAVGFMLGRLFPGRNRSAPTESPLDPAVVETFGERIAELATSVRQDLDLHQERMRAVNDELLARRGAGGTEFSEFVLTTVARILDTNEGLQARLAAAEQQLQAQARLLQSQLADARTDPLTELANRRALDEELARQLKPEGPRPCALAMIDVDHFKSVNDRFGHPAGDYVLTRLAQVLRPMLREGDLLARYGGEEFAVVLPRSDLPAAQAVVERLRKAIAAIQFEKEGASWSTTISLGLACLHPGDTPETLLKRADEALYASKQAGRNCAHYRPPHGPCERITPTAEQPVAEQPVVDTALEPVREIRESDLEQICDDLRAQLARLTERP